MGRNISVDRLEVIYSTIEHQPGQKPGFIARLLGWHRSEVIRALPALDQHGYYLSEDERGGLWPFRRSNSRKNSDCNLMP